MASRMTAP
ncbi:unnamed protein product, partial [Onchocerca ochengi]|uniref:Uncharacterized protein n=1 Tax=Onchocerca ochengi TaxID=42157 RepID=A0A182ESK4_ONCOC